MSGSDPSPLSTKVPASAAVSIKFMEGFKKKFFGQRKQTVVIMATVPAGLSKGGFMAVSIHMFILMSFCFIRFCRTKMFYVMP